MGLAGWRRRSRLMVQRSTADGAGARRKKGGLQGNPIQKRREFKTRNAKADRELMVKSQQGGELIQGSRGG